MENSKTSQPSGRGRRHLVEVAVVGWIDLLGYGSMLRRAAFDPTVPEAIERLALFHETVNSAVSFRLHLAILNDGAIAYLDLSPRSRSVTFDFVAQVVALHQRVNERDQGQGYPGARTVIAAGFRHRGFKQDRPNFLADNLVRRAKRGTLNAPEAVQKALRLRHSARTVPELQANFAFTRAYLADQSGSRAGLAGPHLFLDLCLFEVPPPEWIHLDATIPWSVEGMSTAFGRLAVLDRKAAGRVGHVGIRNALEVADGLSPHDGAARRIRALVLRGNSRAR